MTYGQSFAARQLQLGNFDQALALADQAIAADPDDPEPLLDRAQANQHLGRWEAAVVDVERCLELDRVARLIDDALLDDTLFSTLVAWAQAVAAAPGERERERAIAILERYREILPQGGHAREIPTWVDRFRGKVATWVKDRSED